MELFDKLMAVSLHWFKGSLLWVAIFLVVGAITTFTMGRGGQALLAVALFGAYGFWSVLYLPVRYLFVGYRKIRLRCRNCRTIQPSTPCGSCGTAV